MRSAMCMCLCKKIYNIFAFTKTLLWRLSHPLIYDKERPASWLPPLQRVFTKTFLWSLFFLTLNFPPVGGEIYVPGHVKECPDSMIACPARTFFYLLFFSPHCPPCKGSRRDFFYEAFHAYPCKKSLQRSLQDGQFMKLFILSHIW